jgi:hypothetical protein
MTTDALWTRFVRAWRDVAREGHRRWLDSPERISRLLARLPWIVERDWTWEVVASDQTCVGKFMTYADAARFVARAGGEA